MICGSWEDMRREDIEPGLVLVECFGIELSDLQRCFTFFTRLSEHLVLTAIYHFLPHVTDVGNIFNMQHLEAAIFKGTSQPIGHGECAQIADMNITIDGRATGIHFDFSCFDGNDLFDVPGESVVNLHVAAWTSIYTYLHLRSLSLSACHHARLPAPAALAYFRMVCGTGASRLFHTPQYNFCAAKPREHPERGRRL